MGRVLGATLLLLGSALPAGAQAIFAPTGGYVERNEGVDPMAVMFNQQGLLSTYTAGVTDFDTFTSTVRHDWAYQRGGVTNEWFSRFGRRSSIVVFNFGQLVSFDAFALWNEEANGAGTATFSTSKDGVTFDALFTAISPTDNPEYQEYLADVYRFETREALWFKMEMSDCPTAASTSYIGCGVGEIAFRTPATTVPEPGSFALMAAGLAGFGFIVARRRRAPAA
jgi:hypothetical protein